MASFKNCHRDEIPSASLITHLSPLRSDGKNSKLGTECWCTAFAPNESFFAWSSGNSIITLVPWNYCKSTLFCYPTCSSPAKSGFRISVQQPDEVYHYFSKKAVSIHTRYSVRSIAFGLLTSTNDKLSSIPFWMRLCSSKNLFLATGHNNGHIRIWDVKTGKLALELIDHTDLVSSLSFSLSRDLLLVSSSYDGTVKVWDLMNDGNLLRSVKINGKPIYCCCLSNDEKTIVSVGMSKLAYVWDLATCNLKFQLEGHLHDVVACAFSPDNCLLATASWDTRVILWNAHTGKLLKTFSHQHPSPNLIYACGENGTWIRDLAFSADGSRIASIADDGYLRFWNILREDNPESVAAVEGSLCCNYSVKGGILAVGCRDGSVSFWHSSSADVQSLLFLARIAVRRSCGANDIQRLHIPNCLASYLKYEELD